MSDPQQPWQPDQRKMGNWTSMFDQPARDSAPPQPEPPAASYDDTEIPGVDLSEYRPWQLQRGRSRPALMLGLRRFDAKSGLWHGWSVAYPSLYAVEHIGDRMVTLDFGTRQFALEGRGLDVLADHLQQGVVLNMVEYAVPIWPVRVDGPMIMTIKPLGTAP